MTTLTLTPRREPAPYDREAGDARVPSWHWNRAQRIARARSKSRGCRQTVRLSHIPGVGLRLIIQDVR